MGRKSYEEIGHPLPNRMNIVVSTTTEYQGDNLVSVKSLEDALLLAKGRDVYISGGYGLFKEALQIVDKMYITEVDLNIEDGDTFFPEFDINDFEVLIGETLGEEVKYTRTFYVRKKSRGMGRYILNVVCFFLCPDADCLRNNLYGAIKSEFERVLNMNKEWSELNKTMQAQIKKKDTYKRGIDTLLTLRSQLIQTLVSFKEELCREDFNSIPFINADGYHSKTIAYSIWHIFRIEDIVVHTVINEDEQVFFAGNYQERINSPIITTGNELMKQQIADFSKQLNLEELYLYIFEVWESTEKMLERLSYDELKRKIPKERKGYLESLNVVNDNEKAIWLIDYWCNKDICGLIQMPFSRHWIMHTEACLRIKNKIHS